MFILERLDTTGALRCENNVTHENYRFDLQIRGIKNFSYTTCSNKYSMIYLVLHNSAKRFEEVKETSPGQTLLYEILKL